MLVNIITQDWMKNTEDPVSSF